MRGRWFLLVINTDIAIKSIEVTCDDTRDRADDIMKFIQATKGALIHKQGFEGEGEAFNT